MKTNIETNLIEGVLVWLGFAIDLYLLKPLFNFGQLLSSIVEPLFAVISAARVLGHLLRRLKIAAARLV